MAKYLDNNGFAHFLGKLKTLLDGKVDTESGKGLSTNDYTTAEKNKLAGITDNANNYSLPTASSDTLGGIKVGSRLTISSGVLSADQQTANDFTDTYKTKLDGIAANANAYSLPTASSSTKGGVKIGAGLTMTGEVLSADAQSDTHVNVKSRGTTKAYLLATSTSPTSSNQAVESLAETGVYLDTTAGKLVATSFSGSGADLTTLNGSNISSGTVAEARIASLPASKITSGTFDAARIPDLSATYALKSDITSMYKHKGSVSSTSNLPSSGQTAGDVYNVAATGMNYVWTGSEWDALGEIFTIDSITTTEIDTAFTTAGLTAA